MHRKISLSFNVVVQNPANPNTAVFLHPDDNALRSQSAPLSGLKSLRETRYSVERRDATSFFSITCADYYTSAN
jgi:hypothetical protein